MGKQIHIVSRSFRCPESLSLQINELAEQTDRHVSDVIRDAIHHYIDAHQRSYNSLPGDAR